MAFKIDMSHPCIISRRSRFKGQNWLQGHQNYVQAWEARERVEQDDGARCLVSEFREFLAWLHRSTRISVHQPLSSIPIDEEGSNDNDPYDLMTRTSMQPQQAPLENYMVWVCIDLWLIPPSV